MTLLKEFPFQRFSSVSFALSLIVPLSFTSCPINSIAQNAKLLAADSARLHESYAKIPLSFEANQGQSDPSVEFLSRGAGYSIFLTKAGAVLALGRSSACDNPKAQAAAGEPRVCADSAARSRPDVVRMTVAGASNLAHARVTGEGQLPGTVNYFLGNDPTRWRTSLPTFAKVRYSHVYPGVDLVYYGNQRQLEYDFVVAPGADPAPIRLQFTGEKHWKISSTGDLILQGANGEATFHQPLIYQDKDGRRQSVSGSFRRISGKSVGFTIGRYDRTRPLIIDPVLVYSTYLGGTGTGSNGDQGNGIAVDSTGSAYIVGTTYSTNFPTTTGSFQSGNAAALAGDGSTVFVTKMNPAGTALVYSTYLGGSGISLAVGFGGKFSVGDFGYGIALDANDDAYVTGITYSTDFPVTCGAFQTKNPSKIGYAPVSFVARLSPSGSSLVYSTYLGGSGSTGNLAQGDIAQAIAVDPSGDAYVTGYTWSPNFPTTEGAFQLDNAGTGNDVSNAFVTKLDPTGSTLSYSTYIGGSGTGMAGDYSNGIAVDSSGNAYITGSSASANFPVTPGAFQSTLKGSSNAFVVKLNSTGTDELYSTYLGGASKDSAQSIAVDNTGAAYVAGTTASGNFPVTPGVLEGSSVGESVIFSQGGTTGFVTKLNSDGTELDYSTYLQGTNTTASALAIDSKGDVYVAGSSPAAGVGDTTGFEPTTDALRTPASLTTSGFLAKLNPTATVLNYATLLGGTLTDGATALALDSGGNAFVTGLAESFDFLTTTGAFQTTNQAVGVGNAFVTKLALATEANQTAFPTPPIGPVPTSMTIVSETYICSVNSPGYDVFVTVSLNTQGVTGPPPTGLIWFEAAVVSGGNPVVGAWGGSTLVSMIGSSSEGQANPSWSANYEGDGVYAPSTISGQATGPNNCDSEPESVAKLHAQVLTSKSSRNLSAGNGGNQPPSTENPESLHSVTKTNVQGPKFTPPTIFPVALGEDAQRAISSNLPEAASARVCIAPFPTLTVTLHPVTRAYGSANPSILYTLSGLISGQTVIVTPQTTATVTSPLGVYPVTATVTGPDASNYTITVVGTTLTVSKAPLTIVAKTVDSIYGHTPPQPTAYTITGFVNGDTATVVTGAPALTTTVTAATPVGFYQIGVAVGTLSATNYYFKTSSNGMGVVGVYKAPLTIVAKNEAVTYGQTPAPPTAYTLTGFLNGDTASVVSGAPVLTTSVTSRTPVGFYQIGVQVGTLTAANYDFLTKGNGEGAVGVYKAPLTVTINDLSMTEGGPVPPLTYTLTGFVNGDNAATAVTGTAVLTTTATSASTPGDYPIVFALGTLAAKNYSFSGGRNGVLRVFP